MMPCSRYNLLSKRDGEEICVPDGETVVGRGPFLKVRDKRVSRSHAIISLRNGILKIKPIHENPTFICNEPGKKFSTLTKDTWKELNDGNLISLLPESEIFTVETKVEETIEKQDDRFRNQAQVLRETVKENQEQEPCCDEAQISLKPSDDEVGNVAKEQKLESRQLEQHVSKSSGPEAPEPEEHIKEQHVVVEPGDMVKDSDVMDFEPETRVETSKEETSPMQYTMECSIDSIDSAESRDDNEEKDAQTPVLQQDPELSLNAGSLVNASQNSRPAEGVIKDKKRSLPSWMTSSALEENSNSKKRKKPTSEEKEKEKKTVKKVNRAREGKNADDDAECAEKPNSASNFVSSPKRSKKWEPIDVEETKDIPKYPVDTRKDAVDASRDAVDTAETSENTEETRDSSKKDKAPVILQDQAGGSVTHSLQCVETKSETSDKKLPKCQYGKSCYRKNPLHFEEYSHVDDDESRESDNSDAEKPECPFGTSCYRKNPQHIAEYNHTKTPSDADTGTPKRRSTRRATKRKSVLAGDSDDDGENDYDYDDSFINDDDVSEDSVSSYDNDDDDEDFVPDEEPEDLKELLEEADQIKG